MSDDNNYNPMSGFMPMPFPMAMMMQGQQRQHRPDLNEVPARVICAMEFLDTLTRKVASRGIVGQMGIEIIPGLKLTGMEVRTQQDALMMLAKYFSGGLEPSQWEQQTMLEAEPKPSAGPTVATLIDCPICRGNAGTAACPLCAGQGKFMMKRSN